MTCKAPGPRSLVEVEAEDLAMGVWVWVNDMLVLEGHQYKGLHKHLGQSQMISSRTIP